MGRVAASLCTALVASFSVLAIVGGCSASGAEDLIEEPPKGTEPTNGVSLPPPSDPDQGGNDDIAVDGEDEEDDEVLQIPDGGVNPPRDAGPPPPPPPVPGQSCTDEGEKRYRECGRCYIVGDTSRRGRQETICRKVSGSLVWSNYGTCDGTDGACEPGTTEDQVCDKCGTSTRRCDAKCTWIPGTCTNKKACSPGEYGFTTADCPKTPDRFLIQTCSASCSWGPASATCQLPPTTVKVPPTVTSVHNTIVNLLATKKAPRLWSPKNPDDRCPNAKLERVLPNDAGVEAYDTPYEYTVIENTHDRPVTVTVWHSRALNGGIFDTLLAAYAGGTPPSTATARKACLKGVKDIGTKPLVGDVKFASLDTATYQVPIPARGKVVIYSAMQFQSDTPGRVQLNVRLDKFD